MRRETIKGLSLKDFEKQREYRKKHNLCLHCGKRPCSCKHPMFTKK